MTGKAINRCPLKPQGRPWGISIVLSTSQCIHRALVRTATGNDTHDRSATVITNYCYLIDHRDTCQGDAEHTCVPLFLLQGMAKYLKISLVSLATKITLLKTSATSLTLRTNQGRIVAEREECYDNPVLSDEEKKNGFNTTLFPGGPPPQY